MLKNRAQKGFTLLELLVVIGIIGMLSSVVLTSTAKPKQKAIDSRINTMALEYVKALEIFYSQYNGYPIDTTIPPSSTGGTGDVNEDGIVDTDDLLVVIANWGPCPDPCPADITGNGVVNVDDLQIVINQWGWWAPACLGSGNLDQKCVFLGTVAGQVSYPPENAIINNMIDDYISGPPASTDSITNVSGTKLRGIVYICAEDANITNGLCNRYYLFWFQQKNTNCGGGIPAAIQPDGYNVCVYTSDPSKLPSMF